MYQRSIIAYLILSLLAVLSFTDAIGPNKKDPTDVQTSVPLGTGASASSTTPSTTPKSSSDGSSTSSTLTPSSSPTDSTTPSSTPTIVSSSSAAPSTTTPPSTVIAISSIGTTTTPVVVITTTPPVSTKEQETVVVVVSVSGTQTISQTFTTSEAITFTSPSASTTAGLVSSDDGDGTTGLTSSQKATIGGVVGGLGGAVLLAGLGFVAWRLWGNRRRAVEDDVDLIGGHSVPGSGGGEKAATGDSPFRSTLDQYHSPTGPVNAASNF